MPLNKGSADVSGRVTSTPDAKDDSKVDDSLLSVSTSLSLTPSSHRLETIVDDSVFDVSSLSLDASGFSLDGPDTPPGFVSDDELSCNSEPTAPDAKDCNGPCDSLNSSNSTSTFIRQPRQADLNEPSSKGYRRCDTRQGDNEVRKNDAFEGVFTPLRRDKAISSSSVTPPILNVRVNRAFKKRFRECQELLTLQSARKISYRMYLVQAAALKRVPRIELAAGFP